MADAGAPDSWEAHAPAPAAAPPPAPPDLPTKFSTLNVNALEFIPSFGAPPAAPATSTQPPPAPSPDADADGPEESQKAPSDDERQASPPEPRVNGEAPTRTYSVAHRGERPCDFDDMSLSPFAPVPASEGRAALSSRHCVEGAATLVSEHAPRAAVVGHMERARAQRAVHASNVTKVHAKTFPLRRLHRVVRSP